MAVFMINICKFNGCGITFPRLSDLIEHIEDTHIDLDPAVVEQKEASQPACIPLSYVLRFFTETSKKEIHSHPPPPDVRRRLLSTPNTPSIMSTTPTGSEMDEEDVASPSSDSNDSWTTVEEYSSEFILQYGIKTNMGSLALPQEKPFACPVPGCKKRYKNVNGIKYHSKNGHKKDTKIKKAYRCQCGKSYKTAQGLKSHSVSHHLQATPPRPPLVVTAAPARPITLEDHKLVRLYDAINNKELPTFTIPKHNLAALGVLPSSLTGQEKVKIVGPKVTVQTAQHHTSLTPNYNTPN